jgi:ribose 5-phosphate isomerase B
MTIVYFLISFVYQVGQRKLLTMTKFGKKIAIGSDHAGYHLKEKILVYMRDLGYELKDFGTFSEESVDYADFAHPVATSVEAGTYDCGIVLCGSGNGVNMTVNKHRNIRSALCWIPEIARLSRSHNDANVLAIPARFVKEQEAYQIVDEFMNTSFSGGRHCVRIEKITQGQ